MKRIVWRPFFLVGWVAATGMLIASDGTVDPERSDSRYAASSSTEASFGPKKYNSLILMIDSLGEESATTPTMYVEQTGDYMSGPLTLLADAIKEKAAPIICPSNVMQTLLLYQADPLYRKIINDMREVMKTGDVSLIQRKQHASIAMIMGLSDDSEAAAVDAVEWQECSDFLLRLVLADLSNDDWHGYVHNHADIILLVPKNYMKNRCGVLAVPIDDQIKECGFCTEALAAIDNLSEDHFLSYLQARIIAEPHNFMDALESMFVKKISSDENTGSWHIFLNGHGCRATKKKHFDTRAYWQNEINDTESSISKLQQDLDKGSVYSVLLLNSIRARLSSAQEKLADNYAMLGQATLKYEMFLKKYPVLASQIVSLAPDDYVPATAEITGLLLEDFGRLMNFFEQAINVDFVHTLTCSAGGSSRRLMNQILSDLNVSFLVSSVGVNELSTFARSSEMVFISNSTDDSIDYSPKPITAFFSMLRAFFQSTDSLADKMAFMGLRRENPLAAIVKNVVPKETEYNNQVFIRIPRVGIFTPFEMNEKIKLVSNGIARAHEMVGQEIELNHPSLEAALIYPERISVPIKLGSQVAMIFQQQQGVSSSRKVKHIFEQVDYEGHLSAFIYQMVSFNAIYDVNTFFIKRLTCLSSPDSAPLVIENMIIQINAASRPAKVTISFECNRNIYTGFLLVPSFELAHREVIADACQNLKMNLSRPREEISYQEQIREIYEGVEPSSYAPGTFRDVFVKAQANVRGNLVRNALKPKL